MRAGGVSKETSDPEGGRLIRDADGLALSSRNAYLTAAERAEAPHLQRVLQPAHEMLLAAGLVRDAAIRQYHRDWYVDYMLASRLS